MNFFDNENYDNLLKIKQLNNKIQLVLAEIKEYEAKKKNNIYFLKIQKNTFQHIYEKKYNLLKKYKSKIIKNIITIYFNDKLNIDLIHNIRNNDQFIQNCSIKYILSKIDYNIILRKGDKINKLLNKKLNSSFDYYTEQFNSYNNRLKLQNYNFYIYFRSYLLYNNIDLLIKNDNIFEDIIKFSIHLKLLHLEFKEFNKLKQNEHKTINKFIILNQKLNKNIDKNKRQNDILSIRTENLKNKYIYLYKYILNQEKKSSNTTFNFIKNIHELSIRIELNNKLLISYKLEIEKMEAILKMYDIIKGTKFTNEQQCMICLEDIEYGITTQCKHQFHYSCINLYVFNIITSINNIELKCPLCRQFI